MLFPFIQICIDSCISFETFVQYGFSKLLFTNVMLLKNCKYVSPQKLTFLIQWHVWHFVEVKILSATRKPNSTPIP
jgi:hypothetical protein